MGQEFREDELAAARWIVKVTGHAATAAAAEGECSLQVALRSGEALCDLVNAVWPGRIVGILRGEVKPYLQVENVTRFIKACEELGVDKYCLFAPSDVTEGKDMRKIVKCVIALSSVVPNPPLYDGPRLRDRDQRSGTSEEGDRQPGIEGGSCPASPAVCRSPEWGGRDDA